MSMGKGFGTPIRVALGVLTLAFVVVSIAGVFNEIHAYKLKCRRANNTETVASYFAMLNAFQGSKTAQGPSQQGLGLPKSLFKSSYFAELGNRV